jgi:hypothetical protein
MREEREGRRILEKKNNILHYECLAGYIEKWRENREFCIKLIFYFFSKLNIEILSVRSNFNPSRFKRVSILVPPLLIKTENITEGPMLTF